MEYATSVDCVDIDNPECLCDACKNFFENGFNEVVKTESSPIFKFNPFDLSDISKRINSRD